MDLFHKRFNKKRAMELGTLVQEAYRKFEASKSEEAWAYPDGYNIVHELTYTSPLVERSFVDERFLQFNIPKIGSIGKFVTKEIPMGFIAKKQRNVYLVFRGTMTVGEWRRDASVRLVPFTINDYGSVHDGFMQTYDLFRDKILSVIGTMKGIKNLFVAGHSLGAAITTLAIPDLCEIVDSGKISVYTFGSPRVGDTDFVRAYNARFADRTFRIANTADFVVSVPPPIKIPGAVRGYFAHVDRAVSFTCQKNDIEINHAMETYLSAVNRIRITFCM